MASLVSYRGLQVLDPAPVGDGGLAIQNDLKSLVDWSPKSSWDESSDPGSGDDETDDYYPGSFWLRTDTTPPRLFLCQSADAGAAVWLQMALSASPVATKSAAYTIAKSDGVILANAAGGAFSVTLPNATTVTGCRFVVKRINSGSNHVTISTVSSQTIDGGTSYVLNTQFMTATLISDGSNWFLI